MGMSNLRKCDATIVVGNGERIKATMVGDKHGVVTNRNGVKKKVVFKDTKFIPELAPYNLCSVTHCLKEGFDLSNNGNMIVLKKGDFVLEFDREIKTKDGYVCGVRVEPQDAEEAAPALKNKVESDEEISFEDDENDVGQQRPHHTHYQQRKHNEVDSNTITIAIANMFAITSVIVMMLMTILISSERSLESSKTLPLSSVLPCHLRYIYIYIHMYLCLYVSISQSSIYLYIYACMYT